MSGALTTGLAELVVVFSHPDDEILFFFQAIRWLRPRRLRLLCATGDFGLMTAVRRRELETSARSLGGELINLELLDRKGGGLDEGELASTLAGIDKAGGVPALTHGPLGEYGHRHHVDVFHAVHRRYGEDVWCLSGPLPAHVTLHAEPATLREQEHCLRSIYLSQKDVLSWICPRLELTHLASTEVRDLLQAGDPLAPTPAALPRERVDALLNRWESSCRDLAAMPAVTRAIAQAWDHDRVCRDLEQRCGEWRQALTGDPPC